MTDHNWIRIFGIPDHINDKQLLVFLRSQFNGIKNVRLAKNENNKESHDGWGYIDVETFEQKVTLQAAEQIQLDDHFMFIA